MACGLVGIYTINLDCELIKPTKPQGLGRFEQVFPRGQPGHEGHSRDLYPTEKCNDVIEHHPKTCACCGESLRGEDKNPYRHQIVDIPPSCSYCD